MTHRRKREVKKHSRKLLIVAMVLTAAFLVFIIVTHRVTVDRLIDHLLAGVFEAIGLKLLGTE